jgi:hypothetical protein
MTKDEIRLFVFVMLALIVGASYQHWRALHPLPPPAPEQPASRKWAKPPYVFKNKKELDQSARNVEAEDRSLSPQRAVNPQPSPQPEPSSPGVE